MRVGRERRDAARESKAAGCHRRSWRLWISLAFELLFLIHLNPMKYQTDDLRIKEIQELVPPEQVLRELPIIEKAAETVFKARTAIHRVLTGADDRLLVIMGPCSIHDVRAAKEYVQKLGEAKKQLESDLLLVMRVYFEKPRTTIGWKGLINDPNLDGSFRINEGLRIARQLLLDVNAVGMPAGCEFLVDPKASVEVGI